MLAAEALQEMEVEERGKVRRACQNHRPVCCSPRLPSVPRRRCTSALALACLAFSALACSSRRAAGGLVRQTLPGCGCTADLAWRTECGRWGEVICALLR